MYTLHTDIAKTTQPGADTRVNGHRHPAFDLGALVIAMPCSRFAGAGDRGAERV